MLNCCIERRKARESSVYGDVATTKANSAVGAVKQNSFPTDDNDDDDDDEEFYECETESAAAAATAAEILNTEQSANNAEGQALVVPALLSTWNCFLQCK